MEPAICAKCSAEYRPYFPVFERFFWRRRCPQCGTTGRSYTVDIEDSMQFHEACSGKIKNDSFRGKRKLRGWFFSGHEWSVRLGKFVRKSVSADKGADTYDEQVSDIESGEIIHDCHERLRDHQGHGSAKIKSDGDGKGDDGKGGGGS
jgi:hypothetical protein